MFQVDKEKCVGCGVCVDVCPTEAISIEEGKAIINNQCMDCGRCVRACPEGAIHPGEERQHNFYPARGQGLPGAFTGMGGGQGRGLGRGMGRGMGRGPRDGRGGGRGGGNR
jgi:Fe-S-cluster-containing hydrogenase component 2